jgi:uncharacterized protein DUF7002
VHKLAACLTDMSVTEWLRLLNRKVFFWVGEHRVDELLGARAYRNRAHTVLVVKTAALIAAHEASITLAAINTGSTLYDPRPRGSAAAIRCCRSPDTRSSIGVGRGERRRKPSPSSQSVRRCIRFDDKEIVWDSENGGFVIVNPDGTIETFYLAPDDDGAYYEFQCARTS